MRTALPLSIALLVTCANFASAQNYSFSVPEMMLSVYVCSDSSITLDYEVQFVCSRGADPIDVVDMGLPHKGYSVSEMTASIDGAPLTDIRKSEYIDIGVEVHLGAHAIQPGQSGTFKFRAPMPKMVYQDTTRKDYASLRFKSTWWAPEFVQGTSNLGAVVYLPREIKPEEILHQGEPFSTKGTTDDHTVAAWYLNDVRLAPGHDFALSFPKRVMERVVKQTPWALFYKWWREHSEIRLVFACIVFVLYGICFFRATSGTGCSVFIPLLIGMSVAFIALPWTELLALPALAPIWYFSEKSLKRRKGKYLPAIASVEGGGIKRGLAAPEAAIILELPLNRVLSLIIFGMLKKGLVEQVEAEPLEVKINPALAGLEHGPRRKKARELGTVLRGYEQRFLDLIEENPGLPLNRLDFGPAMKDAIERTAKRMKGHDLQRTRSYYQYIVSKAWSEAKAIGDVEKRTEYTDDNLLWLLAAPNAYDNFGYWHTSGYYYHTPWMRTGPVSAPTPETPVGGQTSFTDVSQSFAGWAENVSGGLAGKIDAGSVGLGTDGLVDLSGVDKVTMDTLSTLAESSGSGGGGGGCACAGCACACACAGGGR